MTHDLQKFTEADLRAALASPNYPPASRLEIATELAYRLKDNHVHSSTNLQERKINGR
jgi:hypothetical protein